MKLAEILKTKNFYKPWKFISIATSKLYVNAQIAHPNEKLKYSVNSNKHA